ncbi:MAG: TlpA family protein disulfide reductase [Chloroflexi bacterium]|nr:TlpA family protein disulfide reductase [Chloroflexota bacterium]
MASKGKRNRRERRRGGGEAGVAPAISQASPQRASKAASRRARSQNNSTKFILFGAVAIVVLLVGFGVFQVFTGAGSISAFDVSLYQGQETLGGDDINFADLLDDGKPIVLNFWGGDCPPCRAEMPAFQNVYENHEGELTFLGVDVGTFFGLGTRQDALDLLRELNITYPAGSSNRTPIVNYSVTGLPTTIFFRANGEVFQRASGALSESRMESIISDMLGPS